MQAETQHESVRHGLIAMLPRLKRFADVLVGDKRQGRALLRRALKRMLADQHRYQQGTPLDRFAFAEIYRLWLSQLRDHADPLRQAKTSGGDFERLLRRNGAADFDAVTASFLGELCRRSSGARCSSSMAKASAMRMPASCSTPALTPSRRA